MKLKKINKHKRDRYVREHPDYENNHIYLIRGKSHIERGYKSTTTWLKQFFEDFDADATIDKYYDGWQQKMHPEYFDLSKEEIKAMWEFKRDDAASKGTYMHLQFENYFNDLPVDKTIDEWALFEKWLNTEVIEPYRTEMTVYCPKLRIVGNVDLICKVNGEWSIVDYKRAEPKYATFGKKCKGAMSEYPHNDSTKHALQLAIYKKILNDVYGFEIKNLYNLYIKGDGEYFFEKRDFITNIDEVLADGCK